MGVTSDAYGSLLIPLIMSRLPDSISLQITRLTTKDVWSLKELMNLLQEELEAREINKDVAMKNANSNPVNKKPFVKIPSATTLHSKDSKSNWPKCFFCSENHYSAECKKVESVSAGNEIIQKAGRCFVV